MLFSTLLVSSILTAGPVLGATLPHRVPRQKANDKPNGNPNEKPKDPPTCAGKEPGAKFTDTSSGEPFEVICDSDYFGGDLSFLNTASFGDCIAACEAEPICVTVAYRDGACYLKNKLTDAVPTQGVWSAKRRRDVKDDSLSCVDNKSDGKRYTTKGSGKPFEIICGKEYPGGDLVSTSTPTFEGCIDACAADEQCVDVSYVNGACYLKSSLTTLTDVAYVWTAKLQSAKDPKPPSGPAPLTCDADDGKTYKSEGGKDFIIECGVDYFGGDLSSVGGTTFETCMDACATTESCVDVSFVNGACYLKDVLNEASAAGHVWTGRSVDLVGTRP